MRTFGELCDGRVPGEVGIAGVLNVVIQRKHNLPRVGHPLGAERPEFRDHRRRAKQAP